MSIREKGEVRLKNTRSDEFGVRGVSARLGTQPNGNHQSDLTQSDSRFLCVLKVLAAQSQRGMLRIASS
jgi:hypothetical protein